MTLDERPDTDVTLGEVNRNLKDFRKDVKDELKEIKTGFVTKDQHDALVARVAELEANAKSRVTTWLAVAGIVIPSLLVVWQALRGGAA
ncbi:hypothetical protein ACTJKO_07575 [Curtobacterium sp. 22159]|uniref:hypothetical protein n=1 Tax=Curtobacterium sp. 22159 TaxID=3453882 RepID=UPI003F8505B3